jgi:hypothetical protein
MPHTLPAINNDYFSNKEPPIHYLNNNNNLDINLINTNNIDTKPK